MPFLPKPEKLISVFSANGRRLNDINSLTVFKFQFQSAVLLPVLFWKFKLPSFDLYINRDRAVLVPPYQAILDQISPTIPNLVSINYIVSFVKLS